MRFCDVCDNMLYLRLDTEDRLTYRCENCLTEVTATEDEERMCVLGRNYIDDDTSFRQYLNKNIRFDPTLPRVNNIPCIHASTSCTKTTDQPDEVTFVKYDPVQMKFLYFCNYCASFWKSGTHNNVPRRNNNNNNGAPTSSPSS